MRQSLRVLAICVAFGLVLVTRDARVTAACSSGIVTSPQGNFDSLDPSTSADGRYTAFWSAANDLVPGDGNNRYDVFVVDRQTCAIDRVSVSSTGVQGNFDSMFPSISGDGRYVAFMSDATTLVPSDTNSATDVFVRDRLNNTTIRASVTNAGGQSSTNSDSVRPDISANGQFVAFMSFAPNLVTGDTNGNSDVFVRDIVNNTTERVSIATGGGQGSDGNTNYNKPAMSDDGRYVAFATNMIGLVPGDTNSAQDIFRHDRQTGETVRVSVSTAGAQTPNFEDASNPAISSDGRFVAFDSYAGNLVAGDTNALYDVFVRDVDSSLTTRVSLINQGGQPAAFLWANSVGPALSGDARYVAFTSGAEDLVIGDDNGWNDVFVHDRLTGITRRVSTSFDGVQGDFSAAFADMSADGNFVAYASSASTLVPDDTNFLDDVFITEWRRVSAPQNVNLMRNGDFASGTSRWDLFATPDMSYIVSNVTSGVFQYYRVAPPPGTPGQAVAFQRTTAQFLPSAPVVATFGLGNSSTARKRISILIHDADFSDLHVCTLWLPAGAPIRTYTMRTHTTEAWTDATIAFYAASANPDGGFLLIDNVTLMYAPAEADDRTDCVDPDAPGASAGVPGPNLITNGTFAGGMTSWLTFGQITSQIAAGVFEFIRPPGTPAGVVFQGTGQLMSPGQILTATFDLGNTSIVRKRVTVLIHEGDFTDLAACTFWLPPSAPLATFVIRAYSTKLWTNATLSVYPATVGAHPWLQLDNVALQRTPSASVVGTECVEPNGGSFAPESRGLKTPGSIDRLYGAPGLQTRGQATGGSASRGIKTPGAMAPAGSIVTRGSLTWWLPPSDEPLELQVSDDGETWQTMQVFDPSEDWRAVAIDPQELGGRVMYLRVVARATS
jgi:Tol biopolymer transport system component